MNVKGTNVVRRSAIRKTYSKKLQREIARAHASAVAQAAKPRRESNALAILGLRKTDWSAFNRGESSAEVLSRTLKANRAEFKAHVEATRKRLVETAIKLMDQDPSLNERDAALMASKMIIRSKTGTTPAALQAEKPSPRPRFHF